MGEIGKLCMLLHLAQAPFIIQAMEEYGWLVGGCSGGIFHHEFHMGKFDTPLVLIPTLNSRSIVTWM